MNYYPHLLRIARLTDTAIMPERKHMYDAGMDIYSDGDYVIKPHSNKIISTGITVEVPQTTFLLLKPKGGSRWLVGSGVVDSEYQGEVLVRVVNPYDDDIVIRKGDAVCQGILLPLSLNIISEVGTDEIHRQTTARGDTGGIKGVTR